jgi:hypothetical protein
MCAAAHLTPCTRLPRTKDPAPDARLKPYTNSNSRHAVQALPPAQARHLGRARFALPLAPGRSPARVLRALEAAGPALGVTAYALSLPTLEQVFLNVIGQHLHH